MIITGKYPNLRLRRTRKYKWSRKLVQESSLATSDFILPIFLNEGKNKKIPIKTMPDVYRYSINKLGKILDKNGYELVQILSYAVKYASNFYGPFRDAVGSKNLLKNDKKNYQMDFRNSSEALREVSLDIKEGADIVMVKPGMPYLDVIKLVKDNFKIPVFAYQVSGEYSLLKKGIEQGLINKNAILESLISFKRAGANAIITYFADQISKDLK